MTKIMNRRNFIQAGASAGAGVLLASRAQRALAQANSSANEINVALIGVGAQGEVLMHATRNIPNLRFKAVCDIWDFRKTYGFRFLTRFGHPVTAYTDYQDMLEKETDLDAVIIATPDFVHHEQSIAAMNAGHHVYCEKMMSNTADNARKMVRSMKDTGKLLQIGHQRRSNPRYLHTHRNLLQRARIAGQVTHVNGQWNRSVSSDIAWPERFEIPEETLRRYGYDNMHVFRNWRWYKRYGGGPLSDLGAHQIDIYNWFLGTTPKTVMADGGVDFYEHHEWHDNVMAIYEYDTAQGPVRAFYQVLTTTGGGGGYWEAFMGTEATVKISEHPANTIIYREARAPEWDRWLRMNYVAPLQVPMPEIETGTIDVRESPPPDAFAIPLVLNKPLHQPHMENFFAAVRGDAELTCAGDEAFESEMAVFKVNEAIEAQKKIAFTAEDFAI